MFVYKISRAIFKYGTKTRRVRTPMIRGRATFEPVKRSHEFSKSLSCRFLDMSIHSRPFLDDYWHAEYAGPNEFELVLSAVQAVA